MTGAPETIVLRLGTITDRGAGRGRWQLRMRRTLRRGDDVLARETGTAGDWEVTGTTGAAWIAYRVSAWVD